MCIVVQITFCQQSLVGNKVGIRVDSVIVAEDAAVSSAEGGSEGGRTAGAVGVHAAVVGEVTEVIIRAVVVEDGEGDL